MAQIFISYRRSETGYVATMLANELTDAFGEHSVFMDVDNIPLGVDFRDHIGSAVSECQVLLALIGDDWLTSALPDGSRRIDAPDDFVRVEIESALKRNIPVIPILTGSAAMPSERELPQSIRALAFRNAAELRAGRDLRAEFQGLLDHLRPILASTEHSRPVASQRPRSTALSFVMKKRPLVIGAICLAALAVVCAPFFVLKSADPKRRAPQPIREVTLQTTDAAISLHKEPNEHSEKIGSLRRGSSVLVVDTFRAPDGREWSRISINPGTAARAQPARVSARSTRWVRASNRPSSARSALKA